MRNVDKLNLALNQMLNGSRCGGKDYAIALLIGGAILHDFELPNHEFRFPIFNELLEARRQAWKSGDATAITEMKADVREAFTAAKARVAELSDAWLRQNAAEAN